MKTAFLLPLAGTCVVAFALTRCASSRADIPFVGPEEGPASRKAQDRAGDEIASDDSEVQKEANAPPASSQGLSALPQDWEPDGSAYFHALDPANRLASLDDSWIPTEKAWCEQVAPLLELSSRLTLAEARALFGEDEQEVLSLLAGEGTWQERFGTPSEDDVLALWRSPGTLNDFATALQRWGHVVALQDSQRFKDSPELIEAIDREGRSAWRRIFEQPQGYRWWPLLAEIGLRLEYGATK